MVILAPHPGHRGGAAASTCVCILEPSCTLHRRGLARVDRRFAYADARLENRGEKYLPWGDLVHLHLALDVRAPIFELVIKKEF